MEGGARRKAINCDEVAFHLNYVYNPLLRKTELRHFLETMSTNFVTMQWTSSLVSKPSDPDGES